MRRVLVVDDEYVSNLYFSSVLRDAGFEVRSAHSGDEAVKIGLDFNPDFLITDWNLNSELGGHEIARTLLKANLALKIIFVTGREAELIKNAVTDISYESIEIKPVDFEKIVAQLEKLASLSDSEVR